MQYIDRSGVFMGGNAQNFRYLSAIETRVNSSHFGQSHGRRRSCVQTKYDSVFRNLLLDVLH